jgi:hypothetical protein
VCFQPFDIAAQDNDETEGLSGGETRHNSRPKVSVLMRYGFTDRVLLRASGTSNMRKKLA